MMTSGALSRLPMVDLSFRKKSLYIRENVLETIVSKKFFDVYQEKRRASAKIKIFKLGSLKSLMRIRLKRLHLRLKGIASTKNATALFSALSVHRQKRLEMSSISGSRKKVKSSKPRLKHFNVSPKSTVAKNRGVVKIKGFIKVVKFGQKTIRLKRVFKAVAKRLKKRNLRFYITQFLKQNKPLKSIRVLFKRTYGVQRKKIKAFGNPVQMHPIKSVMTHDSDLIDIRSHYQNNVWSSYALK
jgi:hypothetical protein